jgi:hypothetical protein
LKCKRQNNGLNYKEKAAWKKKNPRLGMAGFGVVPARIELASRV